MCNFSPNRTRILLALLLALTVWGCSDGGDDSDSIGVVTPAPLSLAGEWGTVATEIADTCGFDPPPAFAPLEIEDNGDSAVFTFADPFGFCEQSVRSRNGDRVSLSRRDIIEAGCDTVEVQTTIHYEFDGDTFTGTSNYHYTGLTGGCSNLPCDYTLAISGSRCDGCFPGCVTAAASELSSTSQGLSPDAAVPFRRPNLK